MGTAMNEIRIEKSLRRKIAEITLYCCGLVGMVFCGNLPRAMTANGSKYIDEVSFFGQRRFYAELYLSNNLEERRVRPCIGPTGSIDLTETTHRVSASGLGCVKTVLHVALAQD
jgi:hypothetical protein